MLESVTPSEWVAVVVGSVAWGTLMAQGRRLRQDVDSLDRKVSNGLTTTVMKIDKDLARLRQAHEDRTGCVLTDLQK